MPRCAAFRSPPPPPARGSPGSVLFLRIGRFAHDFALLNFIPFLFFWCIFTSSFKIIIGFVDCVCDQKRLRADIVFKRIYRDCLKAKKEIAGDRTQQKRTLFQPSSAFDISYYTMVVRRMRSSRLWHVCLLLFLQTSVLSIFIFFPHFCPPPPPIFLLLQVMAKLWVRNGSSARRQAVSLPPPRTV